MYVFPGTRKHKNFSNKVKTDFLFSLSLTGSVRQSSQSTYNVRLLMLRIYIYIYFFFLIYIYKNYIHQGLAQPERSPGGWLMFIWNEGRTQSA